MTKHFKGGWDRDRNQDWSGKLIKKIKKKHDASKAGQKVNTVLWLINAYRVRENETKGQELSIKQTWFFVNKTSLQVHTNRQQNTLLHPARWQKSTDCKWAKSFHQGVFKTLAPRWQDLNDWRTPTATGTDEWRHVRGSVVGKESICGVSTNQCKTTIQWWSENTSNLMVWLFFPYENEWSLG